jgi:hypothetical protein
MVPKCNYNIKFSSVQKINILTLSTPFHKMLERCPKIYILGSFVQINIRQWLSDISYQ